MHARRIAPALLICLAALCSAQNDHSKPYWVKKYNGIAKMFATKDMDAFQALFDPSFVYIDEKKKTHSYADFVEAEISPLRNAKSVGGTVKVTSVKAKDDDVAVSYNWNYWMVAGTPKGDMRVAGTEIGTDHWHKTNNAWLMVKTVIQKTSSTVKPAK
jgi:hypothetical protein